MEDNHVVATAISLPPYWLKGKVVVINMADGNMKLDGYQGSAGQFPLRFKVDGLEEFVFPIDPFISVGLKNIITRRTVAKGTRRGTVKERWTEDDADISISGVFINPDMATYPAEVAKLQKYYQQRKAIDVTCPLLNDKGIYQIAIEHLDFPHTKGAENQAFEIKAYSDDVFQLLIDQKAVPYLPSKKF